MIAKMFFHKRSLKALAFVAFLLANGVAFTGLAQSVAYQIDPSSEIKVDGTSTLTDWSSAVNEFEGKVIFEKSFVKKKVKPGDAVESVDFKFKVKSMDGGRGAAMNGKIFKALKSDEHPFIAFVSTSPGKVTEVDGDEFTILTPGNLSMAGVTKPVEITLKGKKGSNGEFTFSGNQKINMTNYDIEPPSAMFGQIVTGEEITVVFELVAKAANQ